MSTALLPPELEAFPNRYRWTVAECHEMAAEGRLVGRFEVLDGEVVAKMGQKPQHFLGISLLVHWLNSLFGDVHVRVQGPIALPAPDGVYSEPEPDIAVTREPASAYADRHPGPDDILFVAEIADTSLRLDMVVKSRLYARAGIPEYWVIDLSARQLHVFRAPVNGEYSYVNTLSDSETASLAQQVGAPILVAGLLPPNELP